MKFTFKETKDFDLEIDFQKIYDHVKKSNIESNPNYNYTKWDVYNDFGDNMDYYIKEIYGYDVENNEYNDDVLNYIFNELSNWILYNINE